MSASWREALRCPRCRGRLDIPPGDEAVRIRCARVECALSERGFPQVRGRPVLVDFDASVLDEAAFVDARGESVVERRSGFRAALANLSSAVSGSNPVADGNARRFAEAVKALSPNPRVLLVGGAARGAGTAALYADPALTRIVTDIYVGDDVDLVVDGHAIPFADGEIDGVWIQAVLEHVLDPHRVVAEIHRVLRPGGIVYAETPFMQQVHERAYDFTRFTPSGHRWLFRDFAEIAAGTVQGPGQTTVWALEYLARSLFRTDKVRQPTRILFGWLSLFDRLVPSTYASDAASGVFFLGARADTPLSVKDIVPYYRGVA